MPIGNTSGFLTASGGTIDGALVIDEPAPGSEALHVVSGFTAADFDTVMRVLDHAGKELFSVESDGHIDVTEWENATSALRVKAAVALIASGWLIQGEDVTATRFGGVKGGGELAMQGVTSAPADAALVAGEVALWFDSTNGAAKLMVKGKQNDGTVKTAAIALA
jgi:hypothetical protein